MLELLASPKKLQAAEPGERSDPCQPQAANLDRRPRRRGGIGARGTAAGQTGGITLHPMPYRVLAGCYATPELVPRMAGMGHSTDLKGGL